MARPLQGSRGAPAAVVALVLGLQGAPAMAIKELTGHQSLATTQRYMHLSPKAKESAVKLLEAVRFDRTSGDMMETAQGSVKNP